MKTNSNVLEPTQQLEPTQSCAATCDAQNCFTDVADTSMHNTVISRSIDTQMLKAAVDQNSTMEWSTDNEMLGTS